MSKRWLALLVITAALGSTAWAATEIFPLAQVRRGLTGTGRTCLQGREVVEFQVEVLGVMERIIAGHNVVLVRLSGQGLEKTGIFSGMSGSPVYIDGKLLGAIAYGFPFATEPIAGVTPFEEMKAALHGGAASGPKADSVAPAGVDLGRLVAGLQAEDAARVLLLPRPEGLPAEARIRPIESPLMIGGASPAALAQFRDRFLELGLVPMMGAGGGETKPVSPPPRLEPGAGVVVSLMRGDLNVGAGGTVTEVDGDMVLAFGHQFLNTGTTSMAMHDSEVLTVVDSLSSSFKFFTTGTTVGAVRQDRLVGVAGVLGADPGMLPVELAITSSLGALKRYRFEVARDPILTPFFLNFGLFSFLQEGERGLGQTTIELSAEIRLAGGEMIPLRNVFSLPMNAAQQAALYVSLPVQFMLSSQFQGLNIAGISVTARVREALQTARIDEIRADKTRVRPGDPVNFRISLQMQDGTWKSEDFPMRIPAGIPPGPLQVFVGDGISLAQLDQQLEPGLLMVYTSEQLIRALKSLRQNATIYLKLYRRGEGLFARGRVFPALPPSYQEIFRGSRVKDTSTEIRYIHYSEDSLGDKPYVVSGARNFELIVESQ